MGKQAKLRKARRLERNTFPQHVKTNVSKGNENTEEQFQDEEEILYSYTYGCTGGFGDLDYCLSMISGNATHDLDNKYSIKKRMETIKNECLEKGKAKSPSYWDDMVSWSIWRES